MVTYQGCIPVNGHISQTLSANRGLRSVTLSMWLLPLSRPNCHSFIHCKCKCSTPLKYSLQFKIVHKLFTEISAVFYWARELVFTGNKLIVLTTSRELSHYVMQFVFSWIMAGRKVGVVVKSIVFGRLRPMLSVRCLSVMSCPDCNVTRCTTIWTASQVISIH